MYKTISKTFAVILATVVLAACGGGGRDTTGTTDTSGSGGDTDTTTTVTLALQAGLSTLSAGGTTSLTATLTDDLGNPYVTETDVSFSSTCIGSNLATVNSPVTTATGTANSTYTAQGCTGDDVVTASAVIDGATVTDSVTITVAAATLGSIEFVSASPTNIALKGMGGAGQSETSTVTFRVRDTSGGPIANQSVTFTLNTDVGGLQFSPGFDSATSGADGLIQTIVQSGTVATPVRVTATVDATGITTQSDQLVVTTGIPDNNSFSLSAAILNPEGGQHDGTQVAITAHAADRFNNPVPDGTTVLFTTEGGSIGGSCQTTDGVCSVNWVSQDPRPVLDSLNGTDGNSGRVTILATAVGEESFHDLNGNGTYDSSVDSFDDLDEAFLDENEDDPANPSNNVRQDDESFLDFNSNGLYDFADGEYNGVVCNPNCSVSTVNVRDSVVLVMSGSTADIQIVSGSPTLPTTMVFTVTDGNGQIMPAGTTIDVTTGEGSIGGKSSFTVPNTNHNCELDIEPCTYRVFVKEGSTSGSSGSFTIDVTTPLGANTFTSVTVTTP